MLFSMAAHSIDMAMSKTQLSLGVVGGGRESNLHSYFTVDVGSHFGYFRDFPQ